MKVYMVGQPNVGKSSLFSRLTGVGAISSNYPGTTVDIDEGIIVKGESRVECVDLPGTYGLSADSLDERVVIESLMAGDADGIIIVIDATNPEPGLVFIMEVLSLGIPTIVALNKSDLASDRCRMDVDGLNREFNIPFIPVSSKNGHGVNDLTDAIVNGCASISNFQMDDDGLSVRDIRRRRHDVARRIMDDCFEFHGPLEGLGYKLSRLTMEPITGVPILLSVLVSMFIVLSYLGGLISDVICYLYDLTMGDSLAHLGHLMLGDIGEAILTGVDTSIVAILGLVVPYILVFYLMLGILEDSGYLPRAVAFTDRCMHIIGLRGNGLIPLMVGFGCNVPAIMSARTIRSMRERSILIALICLAIPCSSQLAIITGVTGTYAGTFWAVAIFGVLFIIGVSGGFVMDRMMRKERSYMAIELPILQAPAIRNVLMKMWIRSKDFFRLAIPLLIVGSTLIEVLIHFDVLDKVVEPMSWLTVGLLGLPAVVIVAFIAGVVRREMAYGILLALAGTDPLDVFMTGDQFVVFGIVMALFMPCVASLVSMRQEVGDRYTFMIACACIAVSVIAGTLFNHVIL